MRPVQGVHTNTALGGRLLGVNDGQKEIDRAPIRNNESVAVREFPPALAQARAVMVHNAGHPYYIKGGKKA